MAQRQLDAASLAPPPGEPEILALDLTPTAITLHARAGAAWQPIGQAGLEGETVAADIAELRARAMETVGLTGPVRLWLPESEVHRIPLPDAMQAAAPKALTEFAVRAVWPSAEARPSEIALAVLPGASAESEEGREEGGEIVAVDGAVWHEARAYCARWGFMPGTVSTRLSARGRAGGAAQDAAGDGPVLAIRAVPAKHPGGLAWPPRRLGLGIAAAAITAVFALAIAGQSGIWPFAPAGLRDAEVPAAGTMAGPPRPSAKIAAAPGPAGPAAAPDVSLAEDPARVAADLPGAPAAAPAPGPAVTASGAGDLRLARQPAIVLNSAERRVDLGRLSRDGPARTADRDAVSLSRPLASAPGARARTRASDRPTARVPEGPTMPPVPPAGLSGRTPDLAPLAPPLAAPVADATAQSAPPAIAVRRFAALASPGPLPWLGERPDFDLPERVQEAPSPPDPAASPAEGEAEIEAEPGAAADRPTSDPADPPEPATPPEPTTDLAAAPPPPQRPTVPAPEAEPSPEPPSAASARGPDAVAVAAPEAEPAAPADDAPDGDAQAAEAEAGPDLAAVPPPPVRPEDLDTPAPTPAPEPALTAAPARIAPRSVRDAATVGGLALDRASLLGIIEAGGGREALVRLSDGRFRRVSRGDEVDGWEISRIGPDALSLTRRGQTRVLLLVGQE